MINRQFNQFPVLDSERLTLRKIEFEDEIQLYKLLSDEDVARFDYFYPVKSHEQVIKFIERYNEELYENEEITWGIVLKENNKLIGICCLGDFEEGARRSEVGYSIIQNYWGNGYATEAVKTLIKFGFNYMNLNRIEAIITPGNDASVKVLEKLNFTKEGLVRERDLIKGKLEDGIIMAILKREYL